MTTALAVIGGVTVILGAATKIPPIVAALIRTCIPIVTAIHDLRRALRSSGNAPDDSRK